MYLLKGGSLQGEMCFNKEVSLLMFIMGLCTSIKIYLEANEGSTKDGNKIIIATVILGIVVMQLLEYFIFLTLDLKGNVISKYKNTNKTLSYIIHFLILLQTVTYVALNLKYGFLNDFFVTIVVLLALFLFFYTLVTCNIKEGIQTTKTQCRLAWGPYVQNNKILTGILFILYCLIFFILFYVNMGTNGLAIILSTFIFSVVFSYFNDWKGSVGSYWCFLTLLLCIFGGIFDFL